MFALVVAVAAQSRILPPAQNNSNSAKKSHVATVRSSDSPEGSRVAINSDQSLNNYEAYRRGDRFYVKIPATDVPRAEGVRGRGFGDVKAQRLGESTVVSFRLQPGATAHVEQRANKLDVVVTVPGGGTPSVAANRNNETGRRITTEPARATDSNKRGLLSNSNRPASNTANSTTAGNRPGSNSNKSNAGSNNNSASRANPGAGLGNSNSAKAPEPSPLQPKATPSAVPTPSAKPSATPKASASATPKTGSTSSASPLSSPPVAGTSSGDFWARTKERAHYWILLAQLNPIPVALGAALLVLLVGLLLFQRRRAKATRRVKTKKSKSKSKPDVVPVETMTKPEAAEVAAVTDVPPTKVAAPEPVVTATKTVAPIPALVPLPVPAPVSAPAEDPRKERVGRVAEEARKVFSGDTYDEAIIGSDNPETRRLVGAELASALVGRNPEKRERARAAFMKHGYFDDATRDLRVAESENERAAAARRLSFVNDPEATPHLIGALGDPAPDVRRAAVEALMDTRDPQAIAPLHSLLQSETDRKVPRNLIQEAIDACATGPGESAPTPPPFTAQPAAPPAAPINEIEREVIEI